MTVAANSFGSLEKVFGLGQVGVRVAVVYQGVEVVRGFPDALLPAIQAEVIFFFAESVGEGLFFVVEAVEFRDPWICLGIVLAKLGLCFALFVAALEKVVPVIKLKERRFRMFRRGSHGSPFGPEKGTTEITIEGSVFEWQGEFERLQLDHESVRYRSGPELATMRF